MSYWVSLEKDGENVNVDHHEEGGTYQIGGTSEATLNVTYNYSKHFPFRKLHGKTGKDSIDMLDKAVQEFGVEIDPDYWEPTKGNIGFACSILLGWAKQYPEAVWDVN